MKTKALRLLSLSINAMLDLDLESAVRLKKLHGKAVNIELLPFHFSFACFFNESKMELLASTHPNAETSIRGTPLNMLGVMLDKKNRQRFFADDVIIEGNAELGQQVIDLFDQLDIDWEEFISHFIGDIPAHHASQTAKHISGWLKQFSNSISADINEYLHEETTWFPTREALQDLFNDIDTTRMQVDRAEARLHHLQQVLLNNKEETQ